MLHHDTYYLEVLIESKPFWDRVHNKKGFAQKKLNNLEEIPTDEDIIAELGVKKPTIYLKSKSKQSHTYVGGNRKNVFLLRIKSPRKNTMGSVEILYASKDKDKSSIIVDALVKKLKEKKKKGADNKVTISFSYSTRDGAEFYDRSLICPKWEEVMSNYVFRDEVSQLIEMEEPHKHGRLLFWHGAPGTGKTYCIRSLVWQWRKRAKFIYIMDPEMFFGNPGYMFQALLDGYSDKKFTVFIIEDALDFLLEKNRDRMSSSMSRLLNLTEGIVGQGLKTITLITSNEDISNVDPAFTRPGRCLQSLEFKPLDRKQAEDWLKREVPDGVLPKKDKFTLAELYAIKNKSDVVKHKVKETVKIGF